MRVLITGAAGAIGGAAAAALTARGHEVVATARDTDALRNVPAAVRLALDVGDTTSVRAAIAAAGELDAVVNNAALSAQGPIEDFPEERFAAILNTNCLGALRIVQAVVPAWRARGNGVIVNVSSIQGRVATPLEGAYATSKFALEALSEVLHYELSHFGIRTVIVEPGYTAPGTKRSERHAGPGEYAELWQQWAGVDRAVTGPAGRPGPTAVAVAIADAIEDPATPLRVRCGADSELVLAARDRLDDTAFESAMRSLLDISW